MESNSILTTIKQRRTIDPEDFNGNYIDDAIIHQLFEAANWAPTHGYTEPWHFIVFKHEQCRQFGQIHAGLFKEHTPPELFLEKKYDKILHRADNCSHVIICTNKRGNSKNIPDIEEICATSAAIQNLLLAATAVNIATFWSTGGMCHHAAFKTFFNYKEEDTVLGVIYVGLTNEKNLIGKRTTTAMEKVVYY